MSSVEAVRKPTHDSCQVTACSDSGCSLSMEDAPEPRVLINLEHETAPVDPKRPHCDFLFVGGDDQNGEWVSPIELTTGAAKVSKFLPQLRGGAEIADNLIPKGSKVRFRPITVSGKGLSRFERDNLVKRVNHIVFRSVSTSMKHRRCGSPLIETLSG